jgi:hypothetical protein
MADTVAKTSTVSFTKNDIITAFTQFLLAENITAPSSFAVNILVDTAGFASAQDTDAVMNVTWSS